MCFYVVSAVFMLQSRVVFRHCNKFPQLCLFCLTRLFVGTFALVLLCRRPFDGRGLGNRDSQTLRVLSQVASCRLLLDLAARYSYSGDSHICVAFVAFASFVFLVCVFVCASPSRPSLCQSCSAGQVVRHLFP